MRDLEYPQLLSAQFEQKIASEALACYTFRQQNEEFMPKELPPLDVLRQHLHFADDGTVALRKLSATDARKVGAHLGGKQSKGYVRLSLFDRSYLVHRLVFYNRHGWCPTQIDHIDGDKTNNRPENLRAATNSQNQANAPKHKTHKGRPPSARLKGVVKRTDQRWIAQIRISGKQTYLGTFKTEDAAHAAYCEAAKRAQGPFFNSLS
jgi:HNH endonuclease/AP2 domain